jgi:hypothetical protein
MTGFSLQLWRTLCANVQEFLTGSELIVCLRQQPNNFNYQAIEERLEKK